jgi:hypothetical protein
VSADSPPASAISESHTLPIGASPGYIERLIIARSSIDHIQPGVTLDQD